MLECWFVRHGETAWNVEKRIQGKKDIPLNTSGKRQALLLSKRLAGIPFEALYTSNLSRAMETAKLLNEELRLPLTSCTVLQERGFGKAEGLLRSGAKQQFPDGYPEMETEESVRERTREFFRFVSHKHSHGRILVVTHGHWIRAVLHTSGVPQDRSTDNTNVTVIHLDNDQYQVKIINWAPHLKDPNALIQVTNPGTGLI